MKHRVTFVLPSLHGGGAERAAVTLLNGLAERGHDVTLYLFRREGPYFDHVRSGIPVVVGHPGRLARVASLRRYLVRAPQDFVVSFLSHFSTYAAVRAASPDAKYVISQQTPLSAFLADRDYAWRRPGQRQLFSWVTRNIYPRADAIAATSQGVASDLADAFAIPRDRITVIPNPVDIAAVERASEEPVTEPVACRAVPLIVTAGRLAHAKNLPLLVASLELLARTRDFNAWILGRGELEPDLRARLASSSIADRVTLLGFQPNPWKFMARADVFLLTSRYEGFGNVLIEAMAAGLPVVATASYGTRDIVQHEHTGLLVERHEPDAVVAALEHVLSDSTRRGQMSGAGRLRARSFAIPAVVDRLEALLDSMVRQ